VLDRGEDGFTLFDDAAAQHLSTGSFRQLVINRNRVLLLSAPSPITHPPEPSSKYWAG
jgi:hypothetical protein